MYEKIRQNRRKKNNQNRRKRQAYGKSYTVTSRKADSNQNSQQRRNLWTENDEKGEQKMKKTIFEEMGGTYVRCGDYFIPNLILPEQEERRVVGVWGQRHLQYLKEYRRTVYRDLLMRGRLNSYLTDIEE